MLFYASVSVFWNEIESLWLLCVSSPHCLVQYFLPPVRYITTTRYHGARIKLACERKYTLVPLNICTLLEVYGNERVHSCFGVDLV